MSKLLRTFDRLLDLTGLISGLLILVAVVIVSAEVVSRHYFSSPFPWTTEVTQLILVYATFLGAAWLWRDDGHVRVDLLLRALPPRARRIILAVGTVVVVAASGVMAYYAGRVAWDFWERGLRSTGSMEFIRWPSMAAVAFGNLMLSIQGLRQLIQRATAPQAEETFDGMGPSAV